MICCTPLLVAPPSLSACVGSSWGGRWHDICGNTGGNSYLNSSYSGAGHWGCDFPLSRSLRGAVCPVNDKGSTGEDSPTGICVGFSETTHAAGPSPSLRCHSPALILSCFVGDGCADFGICFGCQHGLGPRRQGAVPLAAIPRLVLRLRKSTLLLVAVLRLLLHLRLPCLRGGIGRPFLPPSSNRAQSLPSSSQEGGPAHSGLSIDGGGRSSHQGRRFFRVLPQGAGIFRGQ